MFDLHQICLDHLNHYLTKALVCGLKVPKHENRLLLENFGLIHFLVVSGAHVQFIIFFFKKAQDSVKENLNYIKNFIIFFKYSCLFLLCFSTAFSAPVLRAVGSNLIRHTLYFISKKKGSKALVSCLTILVVSPFCYYNKQSLSFSLSTCFSLICSLSFSKSKIKTATNIYLLSLPVYLSLFSLPHFMTIFLNPFFGLIIAFFLLPLSFLSVFSNNIEVLAMNSWWLCIDLLKETALFFDLNIFEKRPALFKTSFFYAYFCSLLLVEIFLRPLWIRKSYFFS